MWDESSSQKGSYSHAKPKMHLIDKGGIESWNNNCVSTVCESVL